MAIQKINLGAPGTGVGGDKYRDAHTKINDNFTEVDSRLSGLQGSSTSQGVEITALKAKDASQDATIATKANTSDVNAKNGLQDNAITALQTKDTEQDGAIALRALKTEVDSKNTLQDTVITALQDKDVAQDADISLRALKTDVDSKNTLQDTAITAAQNKADAAIPETDKGAVNGVATLGADGKVTPTQLPDVTPVAFGTAATRDVGKALGQIPLIENVAGAYLGNFDAVYISSNSGISCNDLALNTRVYVDNYYIADAPPSGLGGSYWLIETLSTGIGASYVIQKAVGTQFGDRATRVKYQGIWTEWRSGSIDKASNVSVVSIQAGIGAPKIAYKKLTGVAATGNGVPHGLDASKILSISGSYLDGVVYWALTPNWNATEIDINSISSGFSYKLLITYEVD